MCADKEKNRANQQNCNADLRFFDNHGASANTTKDAQQNNSIDPQWVQAFAALASFVVAGGLFLATRNQIRINAAQAAISRRQARIMEEQRRLMAEQAQILQGQATLENRRFIAENRPRLIVRELSDALHYLSEDNVKKGVPGRANSFFTSFSITNTGGTSCFVVESRAELSVWPKVMVPNQFARNVDLARLAPYAVSFNGITFAAGQVESRAAYIPGVFNKSINDIELTRMVGPGADYDVVLHGTILYLDENRIVRCTAFWREYEWGSKGFRKTENKNVEYEGFLAVWCGRALS